MLKSMTSFARETLEEQGESYTWEIRSLNHRYLEVQCRLPESLRHLEPEIREKIRTHLARGKLECSLRVKKDEQSPSQASFDIDLTTLAQMQEALQIIEQHVGPLRQPTAVDILQWPGIIASPAEDVDSQKKRAQTLFEKTLQQLIVQREKEGQTLARFIQERVDQALKIVEQVNQDMPQLLALQKEQLTNRVQEVVQEVDQQRLEQELVILTQKCDIAEELDRLTTHLNEVSNILKQSKPIGRRLDFLMQELNREANTLSAKSLATSITNCAVELKVLIEQMREQVQNIE